MGELVGGIAAIWCLSLLINFITKRIKKEEEKRETRLVSTVAAVLVAIVICTFSGLSLEIVDPTRIKVGISVYLIGGVVIYFVYVRRFKKILKKSPGRNT